MSEGALSEETSADEASAKPDLVQRVEQALLTVSGTILHAIRVTFEEDAIVLRGRTGSYGMKKDIQDAALTVTENIRNDVEVDSL